MDQTENCVSYMNSRDIKEQYQKKRTKWTNLKYSWEVKRYNGLVNIISDSKQCWLNWCVVFLNISKIIDATIFCCCFRSIRKLTKKKKKKKNNKFGPKRLQLEHLMWQDWNSNTKKKKRKKKGAINETSKVTNIQIYVDYLIGWLLELPTFIILLEQSRAISTAYTSLLLFLWLIVGWWVSFTALR